VSSRAGSLPPEAGDIFSVQQGHQLGIPAGRLRARDLDASIYGMRAPLGASDLLEVRCAILAQRITNDAFFSGATAARLMNVPLPRHLEQQVEVDVTVRAPDRAPHAQGLIGHARTVHPDDIRVTNRLRHSSPERVWCELAAVLELGDLVAAGDHLIRHTAPQTSIARLRERLKVADRVARSPRLREGLALLNGRAESRPESLLRVAMHRSGLPRPEVNFSIVAPGGRRFRADLAYPDRWLIIEYQGDYHREPTQWRADMTRRAHLEELGWRVLEVNADDLARPAELCARIRRILERPA
jgi:hypothetical protein